MQLLGHFIVRLLPILVGVTIAVLAASLFLAAGLVGGFFTEMFGEIAPIVEGEPHDMAPLVVFLVLVTAFLSSFHLIGLVSLPLAIAVVFAELLRWRGLTINLVLGGAVALAAGLSTFAADSRGAPSEGTIVILLATGFIGGFFYWLIAGRSAGRWLDRPNRAR